MRRESGATGFILSQKSTFSSQAKNWLPEILPDPASSPDLWPRLG